MLLENTDITKRYIIGKKIFIVKEFMEDIATFCFTVTDKGTFCEKTVENFEGASQVFEIIEAHIRGDSADAIGEAVFQDDGEPVKKILQMFGIVSK